MPYHNSINGGNENELYTTRARYGSHSVANTNTTTANIFTTYMNMNIFKNDYFDGWGKGKGDYYNSKTRQDKTKSMIFFKTQNTIYHNMW